MRGGPALPFDHAQREHRVAHRTQRRRIHERGVVDAQLNARGQAVQDSNRAAPMNFAALDMLRRVESGQIPAPEAYKVGQRWLVYSAAPLRLSTEAA